MTKRPVSSHYLLRLARPVALGIVVLAVVLGAAIYFSSGKAGTKGVYHLGRIPLASEIIHEFVVYNPYPEHLIVSGVRSVHPDTNVMAYDPLIPAHGQGVVRVHLSPTTPGALQARFFIDYEGRRHGLRQLAFDGEVVSPNLPAPSAPLSPESLISASELLALSSLSGLETPVLVDMRGTEDFQRSHLPESLNMSSSQLKASLHLRDRRLILVGEDHGVLFPIAAQLQKAGFSSVRILKDGIPAWQALGAPLIGAERGLPVEISPAAFLQTGSQEGWHVVDLRTKDRPSPVSFPSVRMSQSELQSPEAIQKLRLRLSPSSKLLILSDQGANRESLRDFTNGMKGYSLSFVRGGAEALNRELVRMARSSIKPVTNSVNGTVTASNTRFSRSVGGCRSCP